MVELSKWHEQISQICPIESIQRLEGGDFRIVFCDESTNEQRTAAIQRLIELQDTPDPQWNEFYENNLPLLFALLDAAPNVTAANALMVEFGKRPDFDLAMLKTYWNLSIGLAKIKPDQLAELRKAIASAHLPIQLDDFGRWI